MNSQSLEAKRHFINGKIIIGIDPAKLKHQATIIDSIGVPVGSTFKFSNNFFGFHTELFNSLNKRLPDFSPQKVVFAVEASINLWQKLCYFLTCKGCSVITVSPLFTHHERPKINNNFSRTDPKDALAVANCASMVKILLNALSKPLNKASVSNLLMRRLLQQEFRSTAGLANIHYLKNK